MKRLKRYFRRICKIGQWMRLFLARILKKEGRYQKTFLATSMDLADAPIMHALLERPIKFHSQLLLPRTACFIGWGRRCSGIRAVKLSKKFGMDFMLAEDGFLRSTERLGSAVSIVFDTLGIYYDATQSSTLEVLVLRQIDAAQCARVHQIMSLWKKFRISKYNAEQEYHGLLPERFVLVIDQTFEDCSIVYGLADTSSFECMLKAALNENPNHKIVIKTHPDQKRRLKSGYFNASTVGLNPRIIMIRAACHPTRLIENAAAVYTVTSQVGFEALIWGKRVRTFGMPFYAGWGLTEDDIAAPARRDTISLEQLIYAALVAYPRYMDPETGQRCEVEQAIEHIALQRQKRLEFPLKMTALGFSRWKKSFVAQFLQGSQITFLRRPNTKMNCADEPLVLWGSKYKALPKQGYPALRLEDGFLRSSGLGADLIHPVSLIVDDLGIYYDASRRSRLECILEQQQLSASKLKRAQQLRQKIIGLGLTKYNVGTDAWQPMNSAQKVVLVVGQVESDASIEWGSPDVKSNLELLKRVRNSEPNAYIVYKSHPDVLAKLRHQGQGAMHLAAFCDEVIANVATDALFQQIDELHTMTSLMGFEALMRNIPVVCHGIPFYAGWGLTTDKLSCKRRSKTLSLDALVYGALIAYPRYIHAEKKIFIEPEKAVDRLAQATKEGIQSRNGYRKLIRLAAISWASIRRHDRP